MLKTSASTKWAQFGRSGRSRDAPFSSAPDSVSKEAQSKIIIDNPTTRLIAFTNHGHEQLPERPSTSAGPVSSSSKRRNAERRETKDDLYFNPLASHGKGTTFYDFPRPGLPTPATSPNDGAASTSRKLISPRPLTPESVDFVPTPATATTMDVHHAEIGMALGSPAHPPNYLQQSGIDNDAISPSPDPTEPNHPEDIAPVMKQKKGGWKLFGGLFGAKKTASPTSFYQVQPDGATETSFRTDSIDAHRSNDTKAGKSRGRGRSLSEKKGRKDRPDVKRTETTPWDFDFRDEGAPRAYAPTPDVFLEGKVLVDSSTHQKKGKSLLDVDIPDIHMERYSIMFGSVLGKSEGSSSALLARRKATIEKLKTINDHLAVQEEELNEKAKHLRIRRATSPQQSRFAHSPSFSLFPNTPSRTDHSPSQKGNPNTLQRSNTSPAALSPSRPSFTPNIKHEISSISQAETPRSTKSQRIGSLKNNNSMMEIQNSSLSAAWGQDESQMIHDLSISIPAIESEAAQSPVKEPKVYSLQRNNDSNHTHVPTISISESSTSSSTSSSASESSNSTAASNISSPQSDFSNISRPLNIQSPSESSRSRSRAPLAKQREIPKPRSNSATRIANAATNPSPEPLNSEPLNSEDEQENRLKSAAEVSIARQISVSREQRQLLIPIKASFSVRKASSGQNAKLAISGGLGSTTISVAHVSNATSPLGAVAVAAQEERERTSPSPAAKLGNPALKTRPIQSNEQARLRERLVEPVVLTRTPTLIIVEPRKEKSQEKLEPPPSGITPKMITKGKGSIAERRRLKERNARGLTPVTGELRGALTAASAVRGDSAPPREGHHHHRKSERVVVEDVGGGLTS